REERRPEPDVIDTAADAEAEAGPIEVPEARVEEAAPKPEKAKRTRTRKKAPKAEEGGDQPAAPDASAAEA
ncbi:MAG: hypothetical protein AAF264_12500, partial [Pseudomonadota bacterium]